MSTSRTISLEIFEEHEEVTYYTIKFQGEDLSETDKFFSTFIEQKKFLEDLSIISRKIERIGKSGCEERHVRREGKMRDNVCALPENGIFGCKLRLYGIRLSKNIVILGNGGHKTTKTYNEDPILNSYVEALQAIDYKIKSNLKQSKITIKYKNLKGKLTFQI